MGETGPLDSNVSTSNDESSACQPSMNETIPSNTTADLSHDTPSIGSGPTTFVEALEGDYNSNFRSIDLSASVVNGFDNGHDVDQETGPFHDAILDLDESSVEDNGVHAWREDNSEPEVETEAPVSTKDTDGT